LLDSIHYLPVWIKVAAAHSLLHMRFKNFHIHFFINHLSKVFIVCFLLEYFSNLVMWFSDSVK
jgi:hypothetical protein